MSNLWAVLKRDRCELPRLTILGPYKTFRSAHDAAIVFATEGSKDLEGPHRWTVVELLEHLDAEASA